MRFEVVGILVEGQASYRILESIDAYVVATNVKVEGQDSVSTHCVEAH